LKNLDKKAALLGSIVFVVGDILFFSLATVNSITFTIAMFAILIVSAFVLQKMLRDKENIRNRKTTLTIIILVLVVIASVISIVLSLGGRL